MSYNSTEFLFTCPKSEMCFVVVFYHTLLLNVFFSFVVVFFFFYFQFTSFLILLVMYTILQMNRSTKPLSKCVKYITKRLYPIHTPQKIFLVHRIYENMILWVHCFMWLESFYPKMHILGKSMYYGKTDVNVPLSSC